MNTKKSLVSKKNVVNILSLILNKVDTNGKIAKTLNRSEATISEHTTYLSKAGLIFVRENKKNNEKNYEVDCEKISEIFLKSYLKRIDLINYKSNDLITLTFVGVISIKMGLLKLKPKEFDRISLLDIFTEAWKNFYYRGKSLVENKNEKLALSGYTSDTKKTKEEFIKFIEEIYKYTKKQLDEERVRKEEQLIEDGKISLSKK